MIWILAALLILIAWALKLALEWPLWIPIVVSSAVVLLTVLWIVVRRIRQASAARALERAIAQQGAQQALNARPERRAEITELQKQVQSGINALKTSKLGRGKKGGASALYSLPWYVIIGPPGAGKTTALKHSGLVFPYADASGGGVRGVGGTRNCDWWFTNEAILLDTAGRYTTESDDRDEWLAFLAMLRKFRTRQPINGILIAISVAELIDANEQQLEQTGKKIRARIDEVMTQLRMVVPVYLLFTKCDLIAGFGEFFNDLRKSDRSQAVGTTLKLDTNRNEPGKIFEQEFDLLCQRLHGRALKRLSMERNREARERIYQFPLEFAGMKRNLMELIATTFQVNAFQGTPIFRGFYFTSGTQEGRPLDRVLGRMGQAMGIRTPEAAVQQVVESKSYFLHDVFMNVVFPDGTLASRSEAEIRRQWLMRIAISSAALALAVIFILPTTISFLKNRTYLKETQERVAATAGIKWGDGKPPNEKVAVLTPVLERLTELEDYHTNGPPLGMSWLMYSGETIYRPTMTAYVSHLQQGFVGPCKQRLEDKLKQVKGDEYLKERLLLKTYLMLSDVEHLDVDWATGKFTNVWAEILRSTSNIPEVDLRKLLRGHVAYYLHLLKEKKVQPLEPNQKLVDQARKTLMAVPVVRRYYDVFVNSLIEEKIDDSAEYNRNNRKFPPLSLFDMFANRPDLLKFMTSARFVKEKAWKEVEGPYTAKGHYFVVQNVAAGAILLQSDKWVIPLGPEEADDRVPTNLKRVAEDYDRQFIDSWTDFFADITVQSPATVAQAVALYSELIKTEHAYLRLLRQLEDDTQWNRIDKKWADDRLSESINSKIRTAVSSKTGGLNLNLDVNGLKKTGERLSAVPGTFRRTIEFGVPGGQGGNAPITDTSLERYVLLLEKLRDSMQRELDKNPNVDPRVFNDQLTDANAQAKSLLASFDEKAKQLLEPLLYAPLKIVQTRLPDGINKVGVPGVRLPLPRR